MQVIVVLGLKGGSGKSTLAIHLSVLARSDGRRVLLIDTDHLQGTALAWARARQQSRDDGDVTKSTPFDLAVHVEQARTSGFDVCVVDTAPRADADVPRLVALADLIVIPLRPSMPDLAASQTAFRVAKDSGRPFVVIINAAHPRGLDAAEAREALSAHYRLAPTTIHQRTAFARALASGQAVSEFEPHGKAAQEITEVWSYLKKCL